MFVLDLHLLLSNKFQDRWGETINKFLIIGFELVIGFAALFIITRFLGKTQISQLTPFDFVSAIVLGELLGNALYDEQTGILHVLFVLLLWGSMMFIVKFVSLKSNKTRAIIEGQPSIVIQDGKFNIQEIRRNRSNINQIMSLLRQGGVFSLREVKCALLENGGALSVMRYSENDTPTRKDLNLPKKELGLPVTLISDGKILSENIRQLGLDRILLDQELMKKGVSSVRDVFYAEWRENGGLYLQRKQE